MKKTVYENTSAKDVQHANSKASCYFPILKAKRGELKSLGMLTDETKDAITPVIELVKGCKENLIKYLSEKWNFEGNEIYIDPYILLNENKEDFDEVEEIFTLLSAACVNAIPVVRVDYSDRILNSFKIVLDGKSRIACRVTKEFTMPEYFDIAIERVKRVFGIKSSDINLIIDYSFIDRDSLSSTSASSITLLEHIALDNYLSITVAAGSFVKDLSDIAQDTVVDLVRWEWRLRTEILSALEDSELFSYSDYATRYPIYEYGSQPYAGSSSIRYTTEKGFLVLRGQLPGNHPDGMGQYHTKCDLLVHNSKYDGATFSLADATIEDCANRLISCGNPETWVKISTARHIEKLTLLLL